MAYLRKVCAITRNRKCQLTGHDSRLNENAGHPPPLLGLGQGRQVPQVLLPVLLHHPVEQRGPIRRHLHQHGVIEAGARLVLKQGGTQKVNN